MKRKRFTEEQIIAVLREHEAGAKAADLARKHGVSEATLYNWKAKYGGMDVSDAKRLKALEEENAKLKRLLADQMLEAAALKELLSKNGRARRQARSFRASAGRHEPVGASGLLLRRSGPEEGALPLMSSAGDAIARPIARTCQRAPALRLSATVHPAAAGGRAIGHQSHLPALPRRRADGSQAPGKATSSGNTSTDPGRGEAECAMVTGLRP